MRSLLDWFVLFSLLYTGLPSAQVSTPNVAIRSPEGGEAVQGTVQVSGNANPAGFVRYELAFSYNGDTTGTWFLIAEGTEPVRGAALAEWSTFAITDGVYDLRLAVELENGSTLEHIVEGVRVRNYSLVETSTPPPPATLTRTPTPDLTALFTPSPTLTETPPPTPAATATPLPPNPAEFRPGAIPQTALRGAAGALAIFILLGIYTSIRSPRRK